MKTLFSLGLILSFSAWSQSSPKSTETPSKAVLTKQQRALAEVQEEVRTREAWDRQEQQARKREEFQREVDEERAEGYEPEVKFNQQQ